MKLRDACVACALALQSACAREPSAVQSSGSAAVTQVSAAPPEPLPQPSAVAAATVPQAPDPPSGGNMVAEATLTIHLDPTGKSTLRNGTGKAYWVLHDELLQPSRLEVKNANGEVQPAKDRRAVMKFDNTVRKEHFVAVESGGELPLFTLEIRGSSLRWGPYSIGPLEAGTYTATVIFEARRDRGFDEAVGKDVPIKDAWLGTVRSAPVTLRLPLTTP